MVAASGSFQIVRNSRNNSSFPRPQLWLLHRLKSLFSLLHHQDANNLQHVRAFSIDSFQELGIPRNPSEIQRPNRFTSVYQLMKEECPNDIKAYALCVQDMNNNDERGLQKGSCEKEFSKVKECYQRARHHIRSSK